MHANLLVGKQSKILCMTTRGELIQQWRRQAGLNRAEVGRLVSTSRQNIDNLENDRVSGVPAYLPALARVMGYESTDDLLALKPFPASLDVATPHQPAGHPELRDAKASLGLLQTEEPSGVAHAMSHRQPIIALRTVTREGLGVEKFEEPFQMRIDTDELAPDVPRGRIGRFRPGEPPQPGWPVLLRDPEGGFHLRLYRAGIGGDWEGYSKQSEFKTYERVKHGVEIVATMIGSDWA